MQQVHIISIFWLFQKRAKFLKNASRSVNGGPKQLQHSNESFRSVARSALAQPNDCVPSDY